MIVTCISYYFDGRKPTTYTFDTEWRKRKIRVRRFYYELNGKIVKMNYSHDTMLDGYRGVRPVA